MRFKQIAVIILLLVALLPYCIVCFYALPFADDFCYGWTASENIPFLQKFLNQYLKWNGRYTSDVLVQFHPLRYDAIQGYQWALAITMLATPVVIFVFIRQFVQQQIPALITSLVLTLFYFAYMPNITEGMYWYIGIVNYHIGNLVLLLQVTALIYLLKHNERNKPLLVASCWLLVVAVGFNEIAALLIPASYFAAYLFYRQQTTNNRQLILIHFLVAFIASLFVILAPGNFVRTSEFADNFNVIRSLTYAALQTVRFIGTWSLNYAFVALSLLTLLVGGQIKTELTDKLDWRWTISLAVFSVFMGSFVPYFATGMLGQHRTINMVMLLFLMFWFIFLLTVSGRIPFMLVSRKRLVSAAATVLIIAPIVTMCVSGNTMRIINDSQNSAFWYYTASFITRQNEMAKTGILYPLKDVPSVFTIVDAKNDTTYWVDKCMRNYYRDGKRKLR